jgi:L-aminopeptidase/D-esterase-like protein
MNRRIDRRRWLHSAAAFAVSGVSAPVQAQSVARSSITDIGGIRVGHFTDQRRPTGCTVVLFDSGAVAAVDVRGSAPGTRETDLLNPINTVERVNAIVLAGGSAFGLDAASGVMRYLEENRQGYHVGPLIVPIVPAAIIFDLNVGDARIRPDAESGYAACRAAIAGPLTSGNVGAGAGATVGKFFGVRGAMKGGLGTASIRVADTGVVIGALVSVNAAGDIYDATGKIIAGALHPDGLKFRNTVAQITAGALLQNSGTRSGMNSTIGVIATNGSFTKTEMTKIAQMAHDGLARSVNPVHTAVDGDTIFAAATGAVNVRMDTVTAGVVAAEAVAQAVQQAVLAATGIPGYPAHRDLPPELRLRG